MAVIVKCENSVVVSQRQNDQITFIGFFFIRETKPLILDFGKLVKLCNM